MTNIGYIGLGLMGGPMVYRLLDADFDVRIWGRSPHKLLSYYDAGAIRAESPASLASNCDIVFLCVSNTAAVEDVVFASDGIVRGARQGAILVDMSTIDAARTISMAKELLDRTGMHWIDAPVSGGVPGATNGNLAIMCGGDAGAFERARPVLEHLGRPTLMGDTGAGQGTKLVNQLIVACSMTICAEATHLAARAGIDPERIPVALAGGRADSPVLQQYMPVMARGNPPVESYLETIVKDISLVRARAEEIGARVPMLDQAAAIHDAVMDRGLARSDNSEVYDFYRNDSE